MFVYSGKWPKAVACVISSLCVCTYCDVCFDFANSRSVIILECDVQHSMPFWKCDVQNRQMPRMWLHCHAHTASVASYADGWTPLHWAAAKGLKEMALFHLAETSVDCQDQV